jgi:hypothetical protein
MSSDIARKFGTREKLVKCAMDKKVFEYLVIPKGAEKEV